MPTRERFLAALQTATILDADEWSSIGAHSAVAEAADGKSLAQSLVARGALTKYQASMLYRNLPQSLMFGEYVVLDAIGAGGMGQVFKARHRSMDRIVALKVLSKAAMNSPDAVKRFRREVKAAAKLHHPNIVVAYDASHKGDVQYRASE